jgi:hypothetical protein
VHAYQKSGPLWFPLSTQSVTDARFFGTTDVNIEYFDYVPKTQPPSQVTLLSAKEQAMSVSTPAHRGNQWQK